MRMRHPAIITHAETVARIRRDVLAQHLDTRASMLAQADRADMRGDAVAARNLRIAAAEYAATRCGDRPA